MDDSEELRQEDIDEIMEDADTNKDGEIDIDEFTLMILGLEEDSEEDDE